MNNTIRMPTVTIIYAVAADLQLLYIIALILCVKHLYFTSPDIENL